MIGKIVGSLYVDKLIGTVGKNKVYECVCECGKVVNRRHYQLSRNLNPMCITCAAESKAELFTTHGMYTVENKHHAWHNWKSMILRGQSTTGRYADVTIYSPWVSSYELFIAHIGPKPYELATVDRKDVNKGYEPGNVRWASKLEQSKNKKSTIWVLVDNTSKVCLSDAAKLAGMTVGVLHRKLLKNAIKNMQLLTKD